MIATARQLCDKIQTVRPMKFDENFVRPIGFEGPFTTINAGKGKERREVLARTFSLFPLLIPHMLS